jgi:hypothetical protein
MVSKAAESNPRKPFPEALPVAKMKWIKPHRVTDPTSDHPTIHLASET